jgi:hypothetical protein
MQSKEIAAAPEGQTLEHPPEVRAHYLLQASYLTLLTLDAMHQQAYYDRNLLPTLQPSPFLGLGHLPLSSTTVNGQVGDAVINEQGDLVECTRLLQLGGMGAGEMLVLTQVLSFFLTRPLLLLLSTFCARIMIP